MNYYCADLHFGHYNILHLSNRPFESIEEMNTTYIANWNNVVKDSDDVYILGDFSWLNANATEKILQSLNGKKHLIIGNHDKVILKNEQLRKYFTEIVSYKEINDNGHSLVLFHYPIVEWNGYFRDSIHLYGHIHNNMNNDTSRYAMNMKNAYNVGMDIIGHTPRTLEQIIHNNKL